MPLKARTAPRRTCQRCCPQKLRFVFSRSMGETPDGANPEPIAAMRPVNWALYRGRTRLASPLKGQIQVPELDWEPLSAAVLAGGQSRRMGRDKALLPVHEDGPPLLKIVLDHLKLVATDLFVVATARPEYESFGVPLVPDDVEGGGALSGIHAALRSARQQHCLIVACDMPFLSPALLKHMARQPRDYDVLVPLTPGESRQRSDGLVYQTLHAIYSRTCLESIERQLKSGRRQVIGFFPEVKVRTLSLGEISAHDAVLNSFFNANNPAALAQAAEMEATIEYQ